MRCCISINDAFIIARLYSDDDFDDARVEGDHAQHSHAKSTEHHHKSASAVMTTNTTPAANRRPFGHLIWLLFFMTKRTRSKMKEKVCVCRV